MESPTKIYDQALLDGHDLYESVRLFLNQSVEYNNHVQTIARRATAYRDASQPSELAKLSRRTDYETSSNF